MPKKLKYRSVRNECEDMTMCGYRCDLCKAYARNIERQDERVELSRVWEKYYGFHIPPEDIVCDGCRCMEPNARRIDAGCAVRVCVLEKGLEHCGQCAEYPCQTFSQRVGLSCAQAEKQLGERFDASEFSEYLKAYDNKTRLDSYKSMFYNESHPYENEGEQK